MITDDMTLQDIFKNFYSKAKSVDVKKDSVNSAMSSLNGFSAKLEARRKKAREAKQAKTKTDEKYEKMTENMEKEQKEAE